MSYKEIKVKNKHDDPESVVEIDLDDVSLEDEENQEEPIIEEENVEDDDTSNSDDGDITDTGESDGDDEAALKAKEQEEKAKKEAKQKKRKDRAQKRIKQLHSQKTEVEKELEKERKLRLEAEKKLKEGTKSSKEDMKTSLERNMVALNNSLKEAIENGESEKVVAIQDEIFDAKLKYATIQAELSNMPDDDSDYEEVAAKKQSQVSERAVEWIEDHPEFKTDPIFQAASLAVNNTLISEGFDPETEDFYEELDERLSVRFPDVFGVSDSNDVEYTQKRQEEELDENKKSSNKNSQDDEFDDELEVSVEQTVSRSSRTPPKQGKKRSKNSVTLTPDMVAQAERWGISKVQMARRVAHQEKNSSGNGYVPIKID